MKNSLSPLSLTLLAAGAVTLNVQAQTATVPAQEPRLKVIVSAVSDKPLPRQPGTSDTAELLGDTPGYSVARGGGVSGLPFVDGLGDDRLKIRIDGMEIAPACANHMNAPLSYIDPAQVGHIEVLAGVTPVSVGGDSIGGTIAVRSAAALFADTPGGLRTSGKLSLGGRSNGAATSGGASVAGASDTMSVGYSATYARGHSYDDGDGQKVLSSQYESINQAATLAFRGAGQLVTLRAGVQHIPYQGFPNEYMDMADNDGRFASIAYLGKFGWGGLDAHAYWERTYHAMGFISPERPGTMPMASHGRNAGYTLMATLPLAEASVLRIGQEYHVARLDDFWPGMADSMMMGPMTYVNINGGRRDRLALYGEAETRHDRRWTSLLGARWEAVRMDTGDVQPYADNDMNAEDDAAAITFNARDRRKRDGNLDLTALARYEADAHTTYELAAARKTRSPNLYERYSWGRGAMAMTMTNWFGDGNGYVGNIDLKPETAYTLGFTANWHGGADASRWFVKLAPYYKHVQDYIDADVLARFDRGADAGGALLRFANHDARLYGVDLSWRLPLARQSAFGALTFTGNASLTRGARIDGGDLYHIMPFNTLLTLEQRLGAWTNQIEVKVVARKDRLDQRRLEPETAGYALLNVRTSVRLPRNLQLTAGVSNLLDKAYADPLGGVYLSGLPSDGRTLRALPGYGRSVNAGVTYWF